MIALIKETAQRILADSKKEILGTHKLREIASLYGLIGSTKKEGKYLLIADVFGTLEGQLRRIPSDWRAFDPETKKELQKIIENATDKMLEVAESMGNNPENLFQTLADF